MNDTVIVSLLLGIAWVVIICVSTASIALAALIGREYVLTAPGVSRIGPRIGRRLAPAQFKYQGAKISLRDVLSQDYPTLLIFLGSMGRDRRVVETLVPALQQFSAFSNSALKFVIFCTTASDQIADSLRSDESFEVVELADDYITTRLGIRVTPYAVLVDKREYVLTKGLVNHLEHLCLLVVKGGKWRSSEHELEALTCRCESHFQSYPVPAAAT